MPENTDTLEPTPPRPDRDPEFRTPRASTSSGPAYIPGDHQRLVANPFLGLAALLAWLAGIGRLTQARETHWMLLGGFFGIVLAVRLIPRLVQFHCRDCGSTGRLREWESHTCDAVVRRRLAGRPRRIRGPLPPTQVVVWAYVVVALAVAWNAMR